MVDFSPARVEKIIKECGWFYFGKDKTICIGDNTVIDSYATTGTLYAPCDSCYKGLIFWDYSEEKLEKFVELLDNVGYTTVGKLNKGVVVFYFNDKETVKKFTDNLKEEMKKIELDGRVDWQRSCKKHRDLRPELWEDNKTFVGKILEDAY
jgi:hypothetical protein